MLESDWYSDLSYWRGGMRFYRRQPEAGLFDCSLQLSMQTDKEISVYSQVAVLQEI